MKLLSLLRLSSVVLLLGGCSSWFARQEFKDQLYRQNIQFEVNGQKVDGLGVVSRETKYKIKAQFHEGDFVKIQSCQRDTVLEKEGGSAQFEFVPTEIEKEKYCPLEFFAIENKRGRRGFGVLLFGVPGHSLKADLSCNGMHNYASDMACQAQAGSIQGIKFSEPVVWGSATVKGFGDETKCVITDNFEIPVTHGICIFTFIAKSDFNKRAQLYLLGYKGYVVEQ